MIKRQTCWAIGMAVADLIGRHLRQFFPVGFKLRLSQGLHAVGHRRLVATLCADGAAGEKARRTERKCTRNYHVTPRYVHEFPCVPTHPVSEISIVTPSGPVYSRSTPCRAQPPPPDRS